MRTVWTVVFLTRGKESPETHGLGNPMGTDHLLSGLGTQVLPRRLGPEQETLRWYSRILRFLSPLEVLYEP